MTDLIFENALVMTPDGPRPQDVFVSDGRVVADAPAAAEWINVNGAWLGPAFVDIHTHLREPGHEWKEDIASGSAAAAAGGYGAVVAMPNTDPAIDSAHLARYVAERGRTVGLVDVVPSGALSMGRRGEALSHLDELLEAGVTLFTDDGDTVVNAGLLRRAMEYLADRGGVVAQHAIDPGLAGPGQMHEGEVSSRLGMYGIPAEAEEVIVARDLALVRLTGVRYHVQHLSSARTVTLCERARDEGLSVTCEVTPHHLAFDHRDVLGTDPMYKMMPPLRTPADVAALRSALLSGSIDVVATDHAPHASHEKDVPWEHAPFGVMGLESAAVVVRTTTDLGPVEFFRRMSVTPAAIASMPDHGCWIEPGAPANLVVFDPETDTERIGTFSKSVNSPYLGATWKGTVRHTMLRGRLTYSDGKVHT